MPNKYFRSYQHYFWQWEDNRNVVAIPAGRTIAYKDLIFEATDRLTANGLPPFGSLLLVLAVLHPQGKENLEDIHKRINENEAIKIDFELKDALKFLELLEKVPDKYKSGTLKLHLLQTIFQESHNRESIKRSHQLANLYRDNSTAIVPIEQDDLRPNVPARDFRVIALLNRKFPTVESILEKITDIPILEEEVELEKTTTDEPGDLIEELLANRNSQKIGALVKTLWSGLNLPVNSSQPSQQPIGGVSDLTNKGDLAQLLISEYANDDLLFLSRLANNEALYLNRESPPTTNDMTRVILIDTSLKNWGTPKIISFATMLAIAKHPKTTIECEVYAIGHTYSKINYDSVDGILNALQLLSTRLDPAKGLLRYFEENPPEKNKEIFVLTERSTQKETEMLQAMSELGPNINYWIFNDAKGEIDIHKKLKNSLKHVQHLKLPYQRIWEQNIKKIPTVWKNKELPSQKTHRDFYPILFCTPHNKFEVLSTSDGEVFQLNKSKTLLRWYKKASGIYEHGWEFIREELPAQDRIIEMGLMRNGDYVVLLLKRKGKMLFLINLSSNNTREIKFSQWSNYSLEGFYFQNDHFYHQSNGKVWCINEKGDISDVTEKTGFDELKEKRDKELKELSKKWYPQWSILKNVKHVGINETGNLVLNGHELKMTTRDIIGFHARNDKRLIANASYSKGRIFRFSDGSNIQINSMGMFVLRSSDNRIPTIYIPSIIGCNLGIATENEFTGDTYFYNEPHYEIMLNSAGKSKIALIKYIKEAVVMGLADARDLIENTPARIPNLFTNTEANSLIEVLVGIGAQVEKRPFNPAFQKAPEIIPLYDFHNKYIAKFIQVIKDNGTQA